jgi:hypothetical protein
MRPVLLGAAGLVAAAGVVAGVYVASPGGGDEEVVQDVPTATGGANVTETPVAGTLTPAATPSPAPSGPSADWRAYTDSELGFSLQYPGDLILEKYSGPGTSEGGREDYIRFESPSDPMRIILVALIANSDGLALEKWIEGATACLPDTVVSTTIAGTEGFTCKNQPKSIQESALVLQHAGVIFFMTSTLPPHEFEQVSSSMSLE